MNDTVYKLYECSSVYDKEKKRARKIKSKYLGSITEAGGFKESRKRILQREIADLKAGNDSPVSAPVVGEVKDGHSAQSQPGADRAVGREMGRRQGHEERPAAGRSRRPEYYAYKRDFIV